MSPTQTSWFNRNQHLRVNWTRRVISRALYVLSQHTFKSKFGGDGWLFNNWANSHAGSDHFLVIEPHPGHNRDINFPVLREHISGEIREIHKVCFEDSAQGERRAPFKAQWQDYDLSMRWAGNQTVSKQNSLKLPDYPSLQAHFSQMSLFLLSVYVNWMAVKIIALVLTAIWFVSLATGESPNAGFGNRTTN